MNNTTFYCTHRRGGNRSGGGGETIHTATLTADSDIAAAGAFLAGLNGQIAENDLVIVLPADSAPAPALSDAGYYLLCGGPVALLLLAALLIRAGARLVGGVLAGLLLTLLAGLAMLAWLDVAGAATR